MFHVEHFADFLGPGVGGELKQQKSEKCSTWNISEVPGWEDHVRNPWLENWPEVSFTDHIELIPT